MTTLAGIALAKVILMSDMVEDHGVAVGITVDAQRGTLGVRSGRWSGRRPAQGVSGNGPSMVMVGDITA